MIFSTKTSCISVLAILFLWACSPIKVIHTDQSPEAKFSQYKTFNFYELNIANESRLEPQKENLQLLLNSIEKELSSKGMKRSKSNPDLMINIGLQLETKTQTRETSLRDAPAYIGQRNYSWKSEEVVVGYYEEGTITLDFVDTKSNALAWTGAARSILKEKQEKNKERITEGMQKLLEKFPVGS